MKKRNLKEAIREVILRIWQNAEAYTDLDVYAEIEDLQNSVDWLEDD